MVSDSAPAAASSSSAARTSAASNSRTSSPAALMRADTVRVRHSSTIGGGLIMPIHP